MAERKPEATCRFLSSLGGVHRCADPVHREGFCRFHYEAYQKGEILASGQISEHLSDQNRRRSLNYHGIRPDEVEAPGWTQR